MLSFRLPIAILLSLSLAAVHSSIFGQEGTTAEPVLPQRGASPEPPPDGGSGDPAESVLTESSLGSPMPSDSPEPPVPAESALIVPILPPEIPGIIYVEGEDPVSTNFAVEATYNYSCSGMKALQLNRTTGLQGGAPFYAQFALYVEEEGTYEFWYAGTPPGPRDDLYPSYSSPFRYSVDGAAPVLCYREDVAVVEAYTPSFYWIRVGEIPLSKGMHTLRIEVTEKRRYDGSYLFYLDSFFLMDPARAATSLPDPGTPLFPKDLSDRSIDFPFQSVASYLKVIQENPESILAYKELSMVYSLTGDYLSALRNLKKAYALDPKDTGTLLLLAKNSIWKGDVTEGLELYRELLAVDPSDPALWAEAGKVAAWTSMYEEASWFYEQGIARFPEDLSLEVNYGLTGLWMSDQTLAAEHLGKARAIAGEDPARIAELAGIYMINGYPEFSVELLKDAISKLPRNLELYLLLQQGYSRMDRQEEAQAVYDLISSTFVEDPALLRYLDLYRNKQGLRESILADYRRRIEADPTNLELRTTLAQTYFWNGMKERGIEETRNILVTHAYNQLLEFDKNAMDLFHLADRLVLYREWISSVPTFAETGKRELSAFLGIYRNALKAAAKEQAKETKGENPGTQARDALIGLREEAAALLGRLEGFLSHAAEMTAEYQDLLNELNEAVERENDDSLVFQRITRDIKWEWNRDFTVSELSEIASRETALAPCLLGRIYLLEGRYGDAAAAFALSGGRSTEAGLFAAAQAERWSPAAVGPVTIPQGEEALAYAPYLAELVEFQERLAKTGDKPVLLPEDFVQAAGEYVTRLDALRKKAPELLKDISVRFDTIRRILFGRMTRAWYFTEENTYLIRYELGNYYLAADKPEQAVYQFEKVLAIDPWNISALYKLGTVQQLSGQWSRAMKSYRTVYYADPNYLNAASYHNQLAREHADTFTVLAQTFYDTARVTYLGEAAYSRLISSWIGINASYKVNIDKLYAQEEADTASVLGVQTIALAIPLTFGSSGFGVKPYVGAAFSNKLVSLPSSMIIDISGSPFTPVSQSLFRPVYGLQISYRKGVGSLSLSGGFERKKDTWFPGRTEVLDSFLEAEFSTYTTFPGKSGITSLGTRSYGRLSFLTDSNLLGTAVQEAILSLKLSAKPAVTMDITAALSFENSQTTPCVDYYAPDNVLALKGGLRLSLYSAFPSGDGIGFSLWLIPGGYEEKTGEDGTGMQFMAETDCTAAYYRGDSSIYLRIYGGGTFERGGFPETTYWAGLASLGFSTRLPILLAK
jgi:tetratricopeptide (TPR) repeat protein